MRAPLLGLAVVMLAAGTASADIGGLWKTASGGSVEIYKCGAAWCGKAVAGAPGGKLTTDEKNKDPLLRKRSLQGLTIMTGFVGGPTSYKSGKIYNPEDGNTYQGSILVQADGRLQLKGCVAAPLCRTQTWTRLR